jgi:protein arginine N-methyltransferase 3
LSYQKPEASALISITRSEPFFSGDEYLPPVIEDDPLLREYVWRFLPPILTPDHFIDIKFNDWSDSEDEGAPGDPQDLTTALRRIKILENNLAKAKRDFADYRSFVSDKLDIARLAEAVSAPPSAAPVPRDDDTHYFESYGGNGTGFSLLI